jgi:hypothetical protein
MLRCFALTLAVLPFSGFAQDTASGALALAAQPAAAPVHRMAGSSPGSPNPKISGATHLRPLGFVPDLLFDGERDPLGATALNRNETTVQNYRVAEGTKAYQLTIGQGVYWSWGGEIPWPRTLVKGETVHFQGSFYFPSATFDWTSNGEGAHLKFLRFRTESASGANEGYQDIYIDNAWASGPARDGHLKHIFEGSAAWTDSGVNLAKDRWETIEFQVTFDDVPVDAGGQGRVRLWRYNGNQMQLILDITDRKTLVSPTSVAVLMYVFSYWNGGSPQNNVMQADRLVLQFDQSRLVETDAQGNKIIGGVGAAGALFRDGFE